MFTHFFQMSRYFIIFLLLLTKFLFIFCACPHGAFEGIDSKTCYKFYGSDVVDFYTAEENCANNINGHLASISDAFTNANLASMDKFKIPCVYCSEPIGTLKQILLDPQTPIWLGGNRINTAWTWTDGKPFSSFANWEKGEPKDGNNCAYINPPDGKWVSANCSQSNPYLCEIPVNNDQSPTCPTCACPTQSIYPTQKPIPLTCDSGWTYYKNSNSCYKLIHGHNWNDAENRCVQEGAHLASIHNLLENNFLTNISQAGMSMPSDCSGCVWIGLNDLGGVGSWTWTDGTNFDFQYWAPPEPYDLNGQRCVLLDPDLMSTYEDYFQHWASHPCNTILRAVKNLRI